jgi:hypothetical protein
MHSDYRHLFQLCFIDVSFPFLCVLTDAFVQYNWNTTSRWISILKAVNAVSVPKHQKTSVYSERRDKCHQHYMRHKESASRSYRFTSSTHCTGSRTVRELGSARCRKENSLRFQESNPGFVWSQFLYRLNCSGLHFSRIISHIKWLQLRQERTKRGRPVCLKSTATIKRSFQTNSVLECLTPWTDKVQTNQVPVLGVIRVSCLVSDNIGKPCHLIPTTVHEQQHSVSSRE